MATSGSTDFDLTRNQLIIDALTHCGAADPGETPPAGDTAFAARELNRMIKAWQASGTHLWKSQEATVFLTEGTAKYTLGSSSDHASLVAVKTELASAAAASATSLTVDSITGIAASDNLGIVLDDGTIHWTTQSGTPSGTTLTAATGLASAAAVDNHVYAYTTRLARPLRMTSARRRGADDVDIPIITYSETDYRDTPNKTSAGPPNTAYYTPNLSTGELFLWPTPDTVNDRIMLTVDMPIEDYDETSNNSDLPQEWLDALTWGLARKIMVSYGVPADVRAEIRAEAADSFDRVSGWDAEIAPIQFAADLSYD